MSFYQLLTLNSWHKGWTTLYLSFFIIGQLSTLFELFWQLCVTTSILRWIISLRFVHVTFPNLLWIFKLSSWSSSLSLQRRGYLFHGLPSGLGGNHSWGTKELLDHGQTEAGLSQGFNNE